MKPVEQRLLDLDDEVHGFFEDYGDTAPVKALDWFSKLGDQPELRVIAGGLIVAGIFGSSDRLVRAGSRMIIAHEAATFAKSMIKTEIDRTRPRSAEGRDDKKPRKGKHRANEKTSFPSGHSAGALAAARAFAREYPEYGIAAVVGAGIVAASQVPRRAHYPTDVAAGIAVGLLTEALVDLAWRAARMDERSAGSTRLKEKGS